MHSDDERPLLLVIRTGKREFREYLLRSIAPHYRVHMFLGVQPTWELEYISGWTVIADTMDVGSMISAAKELDAQSHIGGVLCWDEARISQATQVAAALGLVGDPAAVGRCRDKHLTRQALAAGEVPQPQSMVAPGVDDALAFAGRVGYPVIVKPRDLALSVGVAKAENEAELAEYFAFTTSQRHALLPDYRPEVLVEEFADGPEISVDAAVHRGVVTPLCLARKEIGFAPYCIEVGHYVYADDPLLHDPQLTRVLQDIHTALGFADGFTHTEIKLTSTGPKVIEVNARLGGDMIPYLGLRASGADTGLAAAAVACGQPPAVIHDRKLVAAVRFFYPAAQDTLISSIRFAETDLPPAVDQLVLLAEPGSVKSPPPEGTVDGRIAFATAVAETAQECRVALDAAEAALRVNEG
jgi:biotin carboxylase